MKPVPTPSSATSGPARRTLLKTTAAGAALGLLGMPAAHDRQCFKKSRTSQPISHETSR